MVLVLGIIQARMGSTRLSGKVMLPILNKPVIWHIFNRLRKCKDLNKICIATSTNPLDDKIEEFATKENIDCFRGVEEPVLDRIMAASKKYKADAIVRVTADCPLIDPEIINQLTSIYLSKKDIDFVSNTIERTFPDGLDVEVMSTKFLEKLSARLKDTFSRSWFTIHMIENYKQYNSISYKNSKDLSHLRWTLDYEEDYEFIKSVYEEIYNKKPNFVLQDILELLHEKPHLKKINEMYPADTSTQIYRFQKEYNEPNKRS